MWITQTMSTRVKLTQYGKSYKKATKMIVLKQELNRNGGTV